MRCGGILFPAPAPAPAEVVAVIAAEAEAEAAAAPLAALLPTLLNVPPLPVAVVLVVSPLEPEWISVGRSLPELDEGTGERR